MKNFFLFLEDILDRDCQNFKIGLDQRENRKAGKTERSSSYFIKLVHPRLAFSHVDARPHSTDSPIGKRSIDISSLVAVLWIRIGVNADPDTAF